MPDAAALPCASCGYDLRAQPPDGVCPECGGSVAEAIRLAALPLRPAWADSDPRWRRRMLVGLWWLLLMPLPYVLQTAAGPPVPWAPSDFADFVDNWFMNSMLWFVYPVLPPIVGLALVFAGERQVRRPCLTANARRVGLAATYVSFVVACLSLVGVPMLVFSQIYETLYPPGSPSLYAVARFVFDKVSLPSIWVTTFLTVLTTALAGVVLLDCLQRARRLKTAFLVRYAGSLLVILQFAIAVGSMVKASWAYRLGGEMPMTFGFETLSDFTTNSSLHPSYLGSFLKTQNFYELSALCFEAAKYGLLLLVTLALSTASTTQRVDRTARCDDSPV